MYLAFTVWPILASYYYSFFRWNGAGWPADFIGLENYRQVLTDPLFWGAFENSFIYTIATVVIVVPGALLIAMILNNRGLRGVTFFRTLIFLPVVLTAAIVGIIMNYIFSATGFVNQLLMHAGLSKNGVPWLNEAWLAMLLLILIGAWKGFGVKVIYWLAGLQSLPPDLYEASSLDGASESQQFLYITLPLLVPFLIVITILVTNESFKVFDLVRTFTNGGPYFGTDVVPLYIYSQAFDSTPPQMGYASAGGITFGMATVVVSGLLGLLARRFGMRRSVNLRTNRG